MARAAACRGCGLRAAAFKRGACVTAGVADERRGQFRFGRSRLLCPWPRRSLAHAPVARVGRGASLLLLARATSTQAGWPTGVFLAEPRSHHAAVRPWRLRPQQGLERMSTHRRQAVCSRCIASFRKRTCSTLSSRWRGVRGPTALLSVLRPSQSKLGARHVLSDRALASASRRIQTSAVGIR